MVLKLETVKFPQIMLATLVSSKQMSAAIGVLRSVINADKNPL
jgi:hypothetical protein